MMLNSCLWIVSANESCCLCKKVSIETMFQTLRRNVKTSNKKNGDNASKIERHRESILVYANHKELAVIESVRLSIE